MTYSNEGRPVLLQKDENLIGGKVEWANGGKVEWWKGAKVERWKGGKVEWRNGLMGDEVKR